ncbi:hypothetical protein HLH34_11310 [Gluconacetobacter azotocaptans]|uniref:Uncharacterized protein n=1 Tax=Gluconacetobacter azotocaptans TaxID=142834 RepID=A0A7W4PFF5_9PROT|nr:hypothetical protein [Gluconacetobacter azotocaptans]MBB2190544.1 hypothetical protein [Gluconacetobacter azotocaptans]MBM9402369.1 hypothetical protein [Gluconacetobacter azotocaptans]GBQ28394.1 hypothetical protein AA13594_0970 [Gluconacetobacter azotocaptans DSM 13594]
MADQRAQGSMGKQAYEARRAAKAGVSLDKWLTQKDDQKIVVAAAARPNPLLVQIKAGWRRLMDRAHRPL